MKAEPTCGTGLAEHSIFPAKLAAVAEAMAAVLEVHQKALDQADARSREELEAYQRVASSLREGARHLAATAGQMEAGRTIPMGRHHAEAMSNREARGAFADFVRLERELLALLRDWVERDQRMLAEWGG